MTTTDELIELIKSKESLLPHYARNDYYAHLYVESIAAGVSDILTDSAVLTECPDFGAWYFAYLARNRTVQKLSGDQYYEFRPLKIKF
jgi:hypothetical protein